MKYVLMATASNFGNRFSAAGASLFLSFLPMLSSQILLNNLLYDVGQLAIPTDRVDAEVLARRHDRCLPCRGRQGPLLQGAVPPPHRKTDPSGPHERHVRRRAARFRRDATAVRAARTALPRSP